MAELTISMTYGSAMYEVAKELSKEDAVLEELKQISDIFEQNPSFFEFVSTPTIAKTQKKEVLKSVFDGVLMPEVLNFLFVLVDKSRTGAYGSIVKQYKVKMDKDRKISEGDIYSVNELSEEQIAAFETQLAHLVKTNVRLVSKRDPSLIGGVKIFIEGKVIDASVKSRLNSMKESFSAAVI